MTEKWWTRRSGFMCLATLCIFLTLSVPCGFWYLHRGEWLFPLFLSLLLVVTSLVVAVEVLCVRAVLRLWKYREEQVVVRK